MPWSIEVHRRSNSNQTIAVLIKEIAGVTPGQAGCLLHLDVPVVETYEEVSDLIHKAQINRDAQAGDLEDG